MTHRTRFEFATANRVIFGAGCAAELAIETAALGSRALVVTGKDPDRAAVVLASLTQNGIAFWTCSIAGEPTIDDAREGATAARARRCDVIIGLGGGSAIDAGKAVAALATNTSDPLEYLEVIGAGQPLPCDPLPFIAVPTTAGTGSEVTRNAVLRSPDQRVKVSLRHPKMLPNLALVDPELTHSLPRWVTAATGLDALTQVLEPFVSQRSNPICDALCRDGMRRIVRALRAAYDDGANADARYDMSLASLYGGLALANAGLGAVHGIAGPLGGMFPVPHGVCCAHLLPPVIAANVAALRNTETGERALARYAEIGVILTGDPAAAAEDAIQWITRLRDAMEIPALSEFGVRADPDDLASLVAKAQRSSSMKGNPVSLTDAALANILRSGIT